MQSQRWIWWEIQDHPLRIAALILTGLAIGFAAHALTASLDAEAVTPMKHLMVTETVYPAAMPPLKSPRPHPKVSIAPRHTATRHPVAQRPTHVANPTPTPTPVEISTPQPTPSAVPPTPDPTPAPVPSDTSPAAPATPVSEVTGS